MGNVIALWDGGDSSVRKWWLNPYKFVDEIDILVKKKQAKVFFYDLLVNRPTEFRTLIVMFMHAYSNLDENMVQLTHRQEQAVSLARQAMIIGEPPVKYVSQRLNIAKSSACELLQRANTRLEIRTFEDLFAVYDSGEQQDYVRPPSEREIQAQKARMTRTCAADGMPGCKNTTRGQFALCLPCSEKFGKLREEWIDPRTKLPIKWLLEEARRIDIQIRSEAINIIYRDRAGRSVEKIAIAA
jgi:hypothetical protein